MVGSSEETSTAPPPSCRRSLATIRTGTQPYRSTSPVIPFENREGPPIQTPSLGCPFSTDVDTSLSPRSPREGQKKRETRRSVRCDPLDFFNAHGQCGIPEELPLELNLHEHYTLGALLGSGSYGKVYEAVSLSDQSYVAVKEMDKARSSRKYILREIILMQSLRHPSIVDVKAFYEDETSIYVVMERLRGSVRDVVQASAEPLSEEVARITTRQIVEGVDFIHENHIVHRDLKPDNILVTSLNLEEASIKIADFGLARTFSDDMMRTTCGTPDYLAPEIIHNQGYRYSVDMWSIGCIIYYLLSRETPFRAPTNEQLFDNISRGRFNFDKNVWKRVSSEAKDLITRLLQVNPSERYTAKEALSHPWISGKVAPEPTLLEMMRQMRVEDRWRKAGVFVRGAVRLMRCAHVQPRTSVPCAEDDAKLPAVTERAAMSDLPHDTKERRINRKSMALVTNASDKRRSRHAPLVRTPPSGPTTPRRRSVRIEPITKIPAA